MSIIKSLIAHYKMNDNLATAVVIDETGNYNGTYKDVGGDLNTDTGASTGKINGALGFDGTDEYIDCGVLAGIGTNMVGTKTVSLWVKPTAAGDYIFANIHGGSAGGFSAFLDNNRYIKISWDGGTTSLTPTTAITLNIWTHIVIVYNGASSKIYKNSSLIKSGDLGTEVGEANKLRISGRWVTADVGTLVPFTGLIDNVMIFNKALSLTEIRRLYNNGHGTEILAEVDEPRLLLRRNNSQFGIRSRYEK